RRFSFFPYTSLFRSSIGFFNARLQGLYRLERELFERQGRQSWRGERMLTYASRSLIGLTMPSVLIYLLLNRDDEDYEALPEEVKDRKSTRLNSSHVK